MFFAGYSRSASSILKDQNDDQLKVKKIFDNLNYTKELGEKSLEAIQKGQLDDFGKIMHEHWAFKQARSTGMSNEKINEWYNFF